MPHIQDKKMTYLLISALVVAGLLVAVGIVRQEDCDE